jgi:hypothetical protein
VAGVVGVVVTKSSIVEVHYEGNGAMAMIDDLGELERRVRQLERQNRVLFVGFAVLLLAAVGAAVPRQVPDVLRAHRLQLVDGNGSVRAELRHDSEETGLFIFDDDGDTRLGAAHFAHGGSGYALHGPQGRGAAVLYLKGDGALSLYDGDGAVTARFPVDVVGR